MVWLRLTSLNSFTKGTELFLLLLLNYSSSYRLSLFLSLSILKTNLKIHFLFLGFSPSLASVPSNKSIRSSVVNDGLNLQFASLFVEEVQLFFSSASFLGVFSLSVTQQAENLQFYLSAVRAGATASQLSVTLVSPQRTACVHGNRSHSGVRHRPGCQSDDGSRFDLFHWPLAAAAWIAYLRGRGDTGVGRWWLTPRRGYFWNCERDCGSCVKPHSWGVNRYFCQALSSYWGQTRRCE